MHEPKDPALQEPSLPLRATNHPPRELRESVTIGRPIEEVFRFWKDFTNAPFTMAEIDAVRPLDHKKSRWSVKLPFGATAEWDVEIVDEIPNERLLWRSVKGSVVEQEGTVTFRPAPAGRGTVVGLTLHYEIPGGRLAELAGLLKGDDPKSQALKCLRRLKAYLETGEIPTTEGQPSGRDAESRELEHH